MSAVRLRDGKGPPRGPDAGAGAGGGCLRSRRRARRRDARASACRGARGTVCDRRVGSETFSRGRRTPHTWQIPHSSVSGRKTRSRCRRRCGQPAARVTTLRARVSQHVLRRLPNRRRRRRRARDPRASPKARVSCALATRRALGRVFPRDPSARIAHRRAARGGGRRDPRARPRARGAVLPRAQRRRRGQGRTITAIITGASRTRTDRRDGRLGRYPSGRRGAYARNRETRAREREKRARSSVHDDAMLTPSSSRFRQVS